MTRDNYTFGDNRQASARLRRLAQLYEPETRDLLQRGGVHAPPLAIDLGCGPGWSTRLIHDVLNPSRTVGLDASECYLAEARGNHGSTLEFQVHDVVRTPFLVSAPDVLFCRFLLTHLRSVGHVLTSWANIAGPGALLFVHETESMEAEHPTLHRCYDLVAQLQHHYGQTLLVATILEASFENTGWRLVESKRRILEKSANHMAELHLANLQTWRHDEYASRLFDSSEIDSMEASMDRMAHGMESGGVVVNAARQIIAQHLSGGWQMPILRRRWTRSETGACPTSLSPCRNVQVSLWMPRRTPIAMRRPARLLWTCRTRSRPGRSPMRIARWAFTIFLIAPLGSASAMPQQDDSVAAAARRAQEKKAQQADAPKPPKVWDNDNLPDKPGAINVVGQEAPQATPGNNSANPPAADAKTTGADKSARESDVASAKSKLADLKADLDVAQRKYAMDQSTYYGKTNYAADKDGAAALKSEQADIDDKQDQVAAAEKQLAELQSKLDSASAEKPPAAK